MRIYDIIRKKRDKEELSKEEIEFFDNSLPVMPKAPEKKVVLTLRPYTANTKYNWDPI